MTVFPRELHENIPSVTAGGEKALPERRIGGYVIASVNICCSISRRFLLISTGYYLLTIMTIFKNGVFWTETK